MCKKKKNNNFMSPTLPSGLLGVWTTRKLFLPLAQAHRRPHTTSRTSCNIHHTFPHARMKQSGELAGLCARAR